MTTEVVTLSELSGRVGVDVDLLKRMIRTGALPEAAKVAAPDGPTWVVPAGMVDQLVNRHGWTVTSVDLTEDGPSVTVTEVEPASELVIEPAKAGTASDDRSNIDTPGNETSSDGRELVHRPEPGHDVTARVYEQSTEEITVAEIVDGALLNRLLGAHEERAEAEARARESQRAMAAMAAGQQRMVRELAEERYERQQTVDRLRDERSARMLTDAKMAELRARIEREQALAEDERRTRLAATRRSIEAEREAAAALASMGWLARRRFEKKKFGQTPGRT